MSDTISIMSLAVAGIAVVFGPIVSIYVARHQIQASIAIANKQITFPARQARIESLRASVAEFIGSTLHYYVAGYEEREDSEYKRLTYLRESILLMLNPGDVTHREFEESMNRVMMCLQNDASMGAVFPDVHEILSNAGKELLSREWDRLAESISVSDAA